MSEENTRLGITFAAGIFTGCVLSVLGAAILRRVRRPDSGCGPATPACSCSSSTSPATPRPPAAPTSRPSTPAAPASVVYLAQPGEGAFAIALRFGAAGRADWWGELQRANPDKTPMTGKIGWVRLGAGERVRIPQEWTGARSA
jgi:hypothetical protein